jgi:hypothetical protein
MIPTTRIVEPFVIAERDEEAPLLEYVVDELTFTVSVVPFGVVREITFPEIEETCPTKLGRTNSTVDASSVV